MTQNLWLKELATTMPHKAIWEIVGLLRHVQFYQGFQKCGPELYRMQVNIRDYYSNFLIIAAATIIFLNYSRGYFLEIFFWAQSLKVFIFINHHIAYFTFFFVIFRRTRISAGILFRSFPFPVLEIWILD